MNFLGFSLLSFFILTTKLVSAQNESKHEHFKTVEKINKHVLLTIKSSSGDLIDKQNQPTFNHSLLRENAIQFASVVYDAEREVYGAAATIKKEEPLVYGENEYSQAYVQIKTGSGSDLESITVGWHVFPKLYVNDDDGDDDDDGHDVRLFLLWTTDGYQTTKCYNYECDEFEAIDGDRDQDEEVLLGDVLEISSPLPDIHVKIWKDSREQKWWLMIDDEVIGKWKTHTFRRLGGPFTSVEWGGEVSNRDSQMGSGYFGHEESNGACYVRNLEIMLEDNPEQYIRVPFGELSKRETDPLLYDVSINHDQRYIYFGGPGSMASNP